MVKRFLYLFCLLVIGFNAMAQRQVVKNMTTFDDKRLHFGFTLALNTLEFGIDHYPMIGNNPKFDPANLETVVGVGAIDGERPIRADITTLTPGFTVGMVTNLRLTED